ncbi:hypothetical protein [Roseinatronobacter sp. S2]|uniref:hypothetical protein n=1 Tax=Roseinatronobacter sp. S2 TaxID=3035471 RepID=UPI00240EBBEC|nr:hypothetical protein [Roseinatronobacter sp. S2]WFE73871.1 hypothetical protein P8S53_11845 [Roseinatronobacter sp. S2]
MMTHSVRVSGHFGEWIQGRLGPDGPVVLITMPCCKTGVNAALLRASSIAHPEPHLTADHYCSHVLHRFVSALNLHARGHLQVVPDVAAGLGTGVSTAGLMGLARLGGWDGAPQQLAHACIQAEGASDPLMFPEPEQLLWGSRDGSVHAHLPPLPRYEIIGGFWGGPRPTDASDDDFPDISDIVARWRDARDLADFAGLASESARRCLARRGPAGDPTAALADQLGALGWSMAHTGAARGLVFAPNSAPPYAQDALRKAGYTGVMHFEGGHE